ncbi:MerR family transcriptional regulator [Actinophytocola sp.]|uniref:MerR family transcriptional regulator n=1 Tax=Actinophytocola sp. TaxID=1872138 RepID=UPI003D6BE5DC
MHISQLAEISGVPATTLRYYESVGLLPADRDSTGFRIYSDDAITRLAFITAAKHLGLPLIEIRDLLVVCDDHVPPPLRVGLRRQLATHLGEAELRVRELTTFTDSLRCALRRLDSP